MPAIFARTGQRCWQSGPLQVRPYHFGTSCIGTSYIGTSCISAIDLPTISQGYRNAKGECEVVCHSGCFKWNLDRVNSGRQTYRRASACSCGCITRGPTFRPPASQCHGLDV